MSLPSHPYVRNFAYALFHKLLVPPKLKTPESFKPESAAEIFVNVPIDLEKYKKLLVLPAAPRAKVTFKQL